ncbi:growth hormone releasing hormone receptor, like [Conger conger]|uniref:growth hormone releasing hormone receptor, like n=1 Tax=Conger conger TaxID=82655 RepID=UPI002A59DED5|nr:growth hormone releasing hormone receptor, like [Conger conger]
MKALYIYMPTITIIISPQVWSGLHPECEYIFHLEKERLQCLREISEHENDSDTGCPPLWDSVTCWPSAVIGQTIRSPCPLVFSFFHNSTGAVSRNCTDAGWSWPHPPYHIACSVEGHIPEESYFSAVMRVYTVGYSSSLVALVIAVAILLHFRRLRCGRNHIHVQLFLSFILKAVAVLVKDAALFSSNDIDHCSLSTVTCKASVVFCHYCVMTNFFWLLVEGLYLNTLLLSSLHHLLCCFALLGWGVPVVFTVLWIVFRVYFEDTECWDVNEDSPYWWIIKGPIVVSIGVNFVLFLNIIRILGQKLNPRLIHFNNSSHYRRLARATLLLIPLFGTHYMVFTFLPEHLGVGLRLYIELCFGSFQGLIVAVLYCFLNKEVQTEVRVMCLRWWERSYGAVPPGAKGSQMDTPQMDTPF